LRSCDASARVQQTFAPAASPRPSDCLVPVTVSRGAARDRLHPLQTCLRGQVQHGCGIWGTGNAAHPGNHKPEVRRRTIKGAKVDSAASAMRHYCPLYLARFGGPHPRSSTHYMQYRDSQTQLLERDDSSTVLQSAIPEDLPLARSAARLAAEAAFSSTPVGASATQQPLIVYRRKRFAGAGASDSLHGVEGGNVSETRGPRVFRAVAPVVVGAPALPTSPSSAPIERSDDPAGVDATPPTSARGERLAYKRPSKVVRLVFPSEAERGAERVAEDVERFDLLREEPRVPAADRWRAIAAALESLNLSMAELEHLQSLRFESTRHSSWWMKLERKIAAIEKQLQACPHWTSMPTLGETSVSTDLRKRSVDRFQ
jgi:hypothetical protein